jgi:DNA-binding beta-propeller fold protein YncE
MARTVFVIVSVLACALPMVVEAQTPHLIAVDSSRSLYEIDPATGAKTQIGTVSANASTCAELTIGAGNTVYLSSTGNDSLFTVDLATGTATLVGPYGDSAIVMHGLEYVPATDTLYGVSSHNNGLYEINKTTGAATLIGTSGLSSFSNLGWNSISGVMYLTNSGADSFYTIDLATGATTLIGPLVNSTNPNGVAFDPDTGTLYMVDNSTDTFYSIDMATGVATAIGSTGTGNLLGLAWIDGPIPVELQSFTIE